MRVEFGSANAMQSGWGEGGEFYCIPCTMEDVREHADGDIEYFVDSAHRGGFVPVVVEGVTCEGCDKAI